MATRGRPKGSKSKTRTRIVMTNVDLKELQEMTKAEQAELKRLTDLSDRQDQAIAQATDEIKDLQSQVEWYRKQVNHFLALLNILVRGQ
jgi:HAMP domain-containing protein